MVIKKQQIVALSTCEAEYIAAAACACQAMWLGYILGELNLVEEGPVKIYVDNKSVISLAKNPESHSRSKHINIKYHFLREQVNDKIVELLHCKTEENLADIFTKPLKPEVFQKMKKEAPNAKSGLRLSVRIQSLISSINNAWIIGLLESWIQHSCTQQPRRRITARDKDSRTGVTYIRIVI